MSTRHSFQNIQYEIVHFNHKIRNESEQEEEFVKSLAKQYELPIHIHHLPEEERRKSHFQSRARDWRKDIYQKLMKEKNTNCLIATAHHADDQLETFLHKLLRGVSLSHLQPMQPSSANYIRPLLRVHKHELISYLQSKNLSWMDDSSNSSRDYTRNKIRLDVIPILSNISGGEEALHRRMIQLSEQSTQLDQWINEEVLSIKKYCSQHSKSVIILPNLEGRITLDQFYHPLSSLIKIELIRRVYDGVVLKDSQLSYSILKSLVQMTLISPPTTSSQSPLPPPSSLSLSDDWEAVVIGDQFIVQKRRYLQEDGILQITNPSNGTIQIIFPTEKLTVHGTYYQQEESTVSSPSDTSLSPQEVQKLQQQQLLDWQLAMQAIETGKEQKEKQEGQHFTTLIHNIPKNSQLTIRMKQPGDLFQPVWKSSSLRVVDFFRELNIPLHLRHNIPVITLNNQQIVAIPPFVSKRYSKNTCDDSNCSILLEISSKLLF